MCLSFLQPVQGASLRLPTWKGLLAETALLQTCHLDVQVGKRQWERVLDMVGKIRGLNMEVCTTLGMLTPEQAAQLRTAGLTAYNHNLDTSPEYYPKVTSSRKYQVGAGVSVLPNPTIHASSSAL